MQAAGRAQGRYLLLVLLISAYTLSLRFSEGDSATVVFLGLSLPKPIVNAFAVLVLSVMMLALFGTFEAVSSAVNDLKDLLGDAAADLGPYTIDEHPNVADFLSYATRREGKASRFTSLTGLFLYQLPIAVVLVWTLLLWWHGLRARPYAPPWVVWVYVVSVPPLVADMVRLFLLVRERWERYRKGQATRTQG